MNNPRSRLVEAFRANYMDDLSDPDARDAAHELEEDLEEIEALLRIGWEASAREKIADFEGRYNVDFADIIENDPHMQAKVEDMEAQL